MIHNTIQTQHRDTTPAVLVRRDRPTPIPRCAERTVTTSDGVRLAVADYGHASAERTVVFLHGLCLNRESWSRQIDYLLRRYGTSVRVISYDHRGHGRSGGAPMHTHQIERLGADLADVLSALQVRGSLTLVGHSMGGMTALAYLGRASADRPIDPEGLVLVAAAAGKLAERGLGRLLRTPATAALYALISRAPEQALNSLAGRMRGRLSRWYGSGQAQRATLVAVAAAALATTPIPTAVGFLPALCSYDAYRTLGSIRARTVVVSGGADLLTPPAHSRELAAGIAGAEHVHIPAAGHMLPDEASHVVSNAVQRAMFVVQTTGGLGATTSLATAGIQA